MTTRAMVSLAVIVALAPAAARAQGVEIEHRQSAASSSENTPR